MTGLTAWIDARAGVAGDMLLGALVDAGADLDVVRRDVEAVMPDTVTLAVEAVTRGVMRATKLHVESVRHDHHHRAWRDICAMLTRADIPERVRRDALAAFAALARAEGHVHGIDPEDVHFHEVGAWDSVADVVGTCSALADLGIERVTATSVGVGDGFVRGAHGVVPVPVPAVLQLLDGAALGAHGVPRPAESPVGELATPTGVALLVALAEPAPTMPRGRTWATGVGAGTKDGLPWANVVRVVLLEESALEDPRTPDPGTGRTPVVATSTGAPEVETRDLVVLEANVDDLDPRAWPDVIASLLQAGALDAWLTPIVMKKGRPAHTVCALADPAEAAAVREQMFRSTPTLGIRELVVRRHALPRAWSPVRVSFGDVTAQVRVKLGALQGRIVSVTPEFEDAAALAADAGVPVADVLAAAASEARSSGLRPGAPFTGDVQRS